MDKRINALSQILRTASIAYSRCISITKICKKGGDYR